MKILVFFLIFFTLGALIIISNNNLALYNHKNFYEFRKLYSNWLGNVWKDAQVVTGNVIKLNWFSK